ncbi:hypothetical protein [Kitasatospora aureofaciens]|uniref:hypothetical protein n=1 Tax=Kitasatospora aureofaciens TaxID=1894 RepID=UPI0037C88826
MVTAGRPPADPGDTGEAALRDERRAYEPHGERPIGGYLAAMAVYSRPGRPGSSAPG